MITDNMLIRSLTGLLLSLVVSQATQAATINVPYYSEMFYAAYNSDIGTYGVPSGAGNKTTVIAGPDYVGPGYWLDGRTTWQFKLDTLGIAPVDVSSATLNWSVGQILWYSSNLAIDKVDSNFTSWNPILMYGGTNIASGLTTFQAGYPQSGSLDITTLFKTALGNATANSGLALQFYFVGPTGGASPYQGGILGTTSIDVTTVVPEPASLALLALAGTVLLRRRRR